MTGLCILFHRLTRTQEYDS